MKNHLLSQKPIQKFIDGIGKDVKDYFGKDKGCIIALEDDGIFYGEGLYYWLKEKKKDVTLTIMDDYGKGLEEDKVKGRKVVIIDNDIVTGKAYRKVMAFMREAKSKLKIKDVKVAVLCDRAKMADFSVEDYPSPSFQALRDLDEIDLKIIKAFSEEGRKSFVNIAKETGLTPVGVKNRVEKLIEKELIDFHALLNVEKVYSLSASISIEASNKGVKELVKKFENCPLVYNLVKFPAGHHHNLVIGILAPDIDRINDLVTKQIRPNSEVRSLEVDIGEVPVIPNKHLPPNFADKTKKCLCKERCNECEHFL